MCRPLPSGWGHIMLDCLCVPAYGASRCPRRTHAATIIHGMRELETGNATEFRFSRAAGAAHTGRSACRCPPPVLRDVPEEHMPLLLMYCQRRKSRAWRFCGPSKAAGDMLTGRTACRCLHSGPRVQLWKFGGWQSGTGVGNCMAKRRRHGELHGVQCCIQHRGGGQAVARL